jgi:hypothetical protein
VPVRLLLPFLLGLKNIMLFSVSPSFDANMPWRNTITRWLSDKCIMQDRNLATLELIKLLIEENMILSTLLDNSTLHSIILTQVILETLTGITVPQVSQGSDLTYRMDAKEMMMLDLGRKNEGQVLTLEKETGMKLNHYHKLNIGK